MYFNIKCIGKLPGPTNEFERSLVFETGEFERPKFDCIEANSIDPEQTAPIGSGSTLFAIEAS